MDPSFLRAYEAHVATAIDLVHRDERALKASWAVQVQSGAVRALMGGAVLELVDSSDSSLRVFGIVLDDSSANGVSADGIV